MKKIISTVTLALSFFACANLLVPDVLRAGMIKSQFQAEQHIETVRKKLCSKEMLPLIRKFGFCFSNDDAMRIRDVVTDKDVLTSLADLRNGAKRTEKTIRIDSRRLGWVQETIAQSFEKHTNENLRSKILNRGEKVAKLKTENLIASKPGVGNTGKTGQARMSEIRKAITCETLVAMGMSETDADGIVDRMHRDDFERIIQGDVKIAYGATHVGFNIGMTGVLVVAFLFLALLVVVFLLIGLTFAEIGIGFGALTLFCLLGGLVLKAVGRNR